MEKLNNILEEVKKIECDTERAITLMCKLMKLQLFNDGNKRTSMLIANHELIRTGRGLISIIDEYKREFGKKLIAYYEDEEQINGVVEFISKKCLEGLTFPE